MSEYDSRKERAELEDLPVEASDTTNTYPRVSIRVSKAEIALIEQAANKAGVPSSTFIREAALAAATEPAELGEIRRQDAKIVDLVNALQAAVEAASSARSRVAIKGLIRRSDRAAG